MTHLHQLSLFSSSKVAMVKCHLSYSTCLTPGSVEPREAAAGVGPQTIQAAGPVHTGVRITLVHVHLTQAATEALHTLTPERGKDDTVQHNNPHHEAHRYGYHQ